MEPERESTRGESDMCCLRTRKDVIALAGDSGGELSRQLDTAAPLSPKEVHTPQSIANTINTFEI